MSYCMLLLLIVSAAALAVVSSAGFHSFGELSEQASSSTSNDIPFPSSDGKSSQDDLLALFSRICRDMDKAYVARCKVQKGGHCDPEYYSVAEPPEIPGLPQKFYDDMSQFISMIPASFRAHAYGVFKILLITLTIYKTELITLGVPLKHICKEKSAELDYKNIVNLLSSSKSHKFSQEFLKQMEKAACCLLQSVHPYVLGFVHVTFRRMFWSSNEFLNEAQPSCSSAVGSQCSLSGDITIVADPQQSYGLPYNFAIKAGEFADMFPESERNVVHHEINTMILDLKTFTGTWKNYGLSLQFDPKKSVESADVKGSHYGSRTPNQDKALLQRAEKLVFSVRADLFRIVDTHISDILSKHQNVPKRVGVRLFNCCGVSP